MSRVGKKPVVIPAGVTAKLDGQNIAIKGAKGELKFAAPDDVVVSLEGNVVKVDPRSQTKRARAMWGMSRAMIANLVAGVTRGFERKLEINGVGYKAAVVGKNLQMSLGYSHDITYPIPAGVTIVTPKADGSDHQRQRQAAGRTSGRRNPSNARTRALQRQGHQICRRIHLPQGRQEEVGEAAMAKDNKAADRRKARIRRSIRARALASRDLSVFRSSKQIYAQIIDDARGRDARCGLLARKRSARRR